ncbi:hypothetical protein KI387_025237, partial [Taxus chinensis]
MWCAWAFGGGRVRRGGWGMVGGGWGGVVDGVPPHVGGGGRGGGLPGRWGCGRAGEVVGRSGGGGGGGGRGGGGGGGGSWSGDVAVGRPEVRRGFGRVLLSPGGDSSFQSWGGGWGGGGGAGRGVGAGGTASFGLGMPLPWGCPLGGGGGAGHTPPSTPPRASIGSLFLSAGGGGLR